MKSSKTFAYSFPNVCNHHCTNNRISQVLEYHGNLKKTKSISSFHQPLDIKKDRISHHRKVQNKKFSVISKYHLFHQVLDSKDTLFHITEKFKRKAFQ